MKKGKFLQWCWNCKGSRSNKDIKKENLEKNQVNLIKTNHHIIMTYDHPVSSNNSFKNIFNAKSCAKHGDSVSVSVAVKFLPNQLKPFFNTILIMIFIGFPILPYSIQPHVTTSTE